MGISEYIKRLDAPLDDQRKRENRTKQPTPTPAPAVGARKKKLHSKKQQPQPHAPKPRLIFQANSPHGVRASPALPGPSVRSGGIHKRLALPRRTLSTSSPGVRAPPVLGPHPRLQGGGGSKSGPAAFPARLVRTVEITPTTRFPVTSTHHPSSQLQAQTMVIPAQPSPQWNHAPYMATSTIIQPSPRPLHQAGGPPPFPQTLTPTIPLPSHPRATPTSFTLYNPDAIPGNTNGKPKGKTAPRPKSVPGQKDAAPQVKTKVLPRSLPRDAPVSLPKGPATKESTPKGPMPIVIDGPVAAGSSSAPPTVSPSPGAGISIRGKAGPVLVKIYNLHPETTEEDLLLELRRYADIISGHLLYLRGGISTGNGELIFRLRKQAEAMVNRLDGTMVDGYVVRMEIAKDMEDRDVVMEEGLVPAESRDVLQSSAAKSRSQVGGNKGMYSDRI